MAYSGSASDRLTAVRSAIDRALTSQAYTVRGRSQQNALIDKLFEQEAKLQEEVNQEAAGGNMSSLAIVTRPT